MIDIEKMIATVVAEIGIDGETAIRFFNQMIVGDDLSFSIIDHKLGSLQTLLSVGYGNEKDSPGESSTIMVEEPFEFFNKDGLLCVDKILPLLPPVAHDISKNQLYAFFHALNCAQKALAFFNNKNKDATYELVVPVLCCGIHPNCDHQYFFHTNFFAKPAGSGTTSAPELFFAELEACGVFVEEEPVRRCCILKSNIIGVSPPGPLKVFAPVGIFHPEDVQCPCNIDPPGYCESD